MPTDWEARFDALDQRLLEIDERLTRLCCVVEKMQRSCHNMDEHISFVERIYDVVRQPLTFVLARFRGRALPGARPAALPNLIPD